MLVQAPPRHTSTRPTTGFPVPTSRTSPLEQLKSPTARIESAGEEGGGREEGKEGGGRGRGKREGREERGKGERGAGREKGKGGGGGEGKGEGEEEGEERKEGGERGDRGGGGGKKRVERRGWEEREGVREEKEECEGVFAHAQYNRVESWGGGGGYSQEQTTLASPTRLHPVKGFSGELVVLQVSKFGSVPLHWRLPSTRKSEPFPNSLWIPTAKSRPEEKEKKKEELMKLTASYVTLECKTGPTTGAINRSGTTPLTALDRASTVVQGHMHSTWYYKGH